MTRQSRVAHSTDQVNQTPHHCTVLNREVTLSVFQVQRIPLIARLRTHGRGARVEQGEYYSSLSEKCCGFDQGNNSQRGGEEWTDYRDMGQISHIMIQPESDLYEFWIQREMKEQERPLPGSKDGLGVILSFRIGQREASQERASTGGRPKCARNANHRFWTGRGSDRGRQRNGAGGSQEMAGTLDIQFPWERVATDSPVWENKNACGS